MRPQPAQVLVRLSQQQAARAEKLRQRLQEVLGVSDLLPLACAIHTRLRAVQEVAQLQPHAAAVVVAAAEGSAALASQEGRTQIATVGAVAVVLDFSSQAGPAGR